MKKNMKKKMKKNKEEEEEEDEEEEDNSVSNIHISFDNSYVVTYDREAFALWNLEVGEPEGFWRIDEVSIRDIAVSNQG